MIKVNLILGFLGAGKTTLIKSILHKGLLKDEQVILIVNDYGPENYDSQILKETGVEIIEVTNGCLCCGNQDGFQDILKELSDRKDLDRIIIEPSGLFFPDQVIPAFEKEPLQKLMKLEPIFVILDLVFLSKTNRTWPPFISRQIEIAYAIVLNRNDEISEQATQKIIAIIRSFNLEVQLLSFSDAVERFRDEAKVINHNYSFRKKSDPSHSIKFKNETTNTSFKDIDELKRYFEMQSSQLIRAKGVVKINDEKVYVNYTKSGLEITKVTDTNQLGLSCFLSNSDEDFMK